MNKTDLISYTIDFVSFLIKKKSKINKIILFGSVARDEFDKESDIDLFIDTNINQDEIESILELYEISEDNKKYELEGIKNKIRLKIGKLDEWESIKRGIISDGILLYGKYEEMPKGIKNYILFKISIKKTERKNKIKIWRKLYGYKQKVGKKIYHSMGLIEENDGKKLALGLFLIPNEKSQMIIKYLIEKKINYELKEIFMD
jgi:predicted nucleotidyltransferase